MKEKKKVTFSKHGNVETHVLLGIHILTKMGLSENSDTYWYAFDSLLWFATKDNNIRKFFNNIPKKPKTCTTLYQKPYRNLKGGVSFQ